MPIIKSAKKRVRVSAKASDRNRDTKGKLRSALKAFTNAVKNNKGVPSAHAEAQSAVDQAVKKGILHKNKGARRKSQLTIEAKNAGTTVKGNGNAKVTKAAPAKKVATKPATKKVAAKPVAKKPAAKKTPAKKTTKK